MQTSNYITAIQTFSRRFHRCKVFLRNADVNESGDYLPAKGSFKIAELSQKVMLLKVYKWE